MPLDEPLFVVGPPGSGKTVLAVRRARALAEDSREAVLITYNRLLRRQASLLQWQLAAGGRCWNPAECQYDAQLRLV
jgi:MoxR-like ATPase